MTRESQVAQGLSWCTLRKGGSEEEASFGSAAMRVSCASGCQLGSTKRLPQQGGGTGRVLYFGFRYVLFLVAYIPGK